MAPSATRTAGRLQAGIERICRAELDARELVRAVARQLAAALPNDGLLVLRTDPTTVLPTDGVVEALPPALCQPFWDNELREPDFNKFVALARGGPGAATLAGATGGELDRSRRYTSLYRALGITDELRASFTARDGSCWGIAQLVRTGGGRFSPAERDLLAAVAPVVAAGLRARFALAAPAVSPHRGPALVILGKDGEIESITPEAREWLAELVDGSATGMAPVPEPVYVVAGRARAARAGAGGGAPGERGPAGGGGLAGGGSAAGVQLRTASRGWLHLHATCLEEPGGAAGESVAVVITPARAPELMPLLALGYRLTQREQEVLRFLARGMSTAEMTHQLGISSHTVRDHIKSLFGKVCVRSRAELLARLFAEHYFDRLEADIERLDG